MRRRNLIEILLVEDNPGDASLIQEVLSEAKVLNRVQHVEDGSEAVKFLRHEGEHAEAPAPHLIILDLSLPSIDGRQVLSEVKADAALRSIPVVILTSSQTEQDVKRCHEDHANCFITKPTETDELARVVRSVARFWLEIVTLPNQ